MREPSHDNVALVDNKKIWPAQAEGDSLCLSLPPVLSKPKKNYFELRELIRIYGDVKFGVTKGVDFVSLWSQQ